MRVLVIAPMPSNDTVAPPSGVAHYVDQMLGAPVEDVVFHVLAQDDAFEYSDSTVEVRAVWRPGRHAPFDIGRSLLSGDYNVVHFHHEFRILGGIISTLMLMPILLAARVSGRRVIVTVHGVVPKSDLRIMAPSRLFRVMHGLWRQLLSVNYKGFASACDQLVVHHEYFRERLLDDWGLSAKKVVVVPFGYEPRIESINANCEESALSTPARAINVLVFGFLTSYKRPEVLMDLAEVDITGQMRYHFCISRNPRTRNATYGERLFRLQQRAESIQDRVCWYNYLPDEELRRLISRADVIVLPYVSCLAASGVASWAIEFEKPFCYSDALVPVFGTGPMAFSDEPVDLRRAIIEAHNSGNLRSGELFEPWEIVRKQLRDMWLRGRLS